MKHDWEYKKLGDVCEIYQPKTISSNMLVDNGKYPVYGANGIIGRYDQFNHPDKELLMTCRGATCGTINISLPYSWINGNAMVIHPLKNDIILDFLKYQLSALDLSVVITGAAQPQITRQSLSPLSISIPPIEEQKKICSLLDKMNRVIEAKKEQQKELDNLAQAIFYNMFGDPINNPQGWEVKQFGEECTELRYGTSRPACENGQYKYLRMGNLTTSGHLDLTDLKTIDIPESEVDKCLVKYGDVLFNRTNSLDLIGKTCMFDLEEPMIIAGYIIRVRLSDRLTPRYVSVAFNMPSMKNLLRKMAKGAVNQANINSKELASIRIPVPPLPLQQAFAEIVKAIEQQKELINQSIKDVQTLFDAKMDYYFGD